MNSWGGSAQALEFRAFNAVRRKTRLSDPLHLELQPGTVLGIIGPNGVGKSSLLGALAQTGVSSEGQAVWNGRDILSLRAAERARILSFMPQAVSAPAELRAYQAVEVGARASAQPRISEAIESAFSRAGIVDLPGRKLGTLSGGQRQLVQLARVLAQNTPIIALDEPTSALDLQHQGRVEKLIEELGALGKIVLAVVHDLDIALNACTHVLLLHPDGRSTFGEPARVLGTEQILSAYGVRTTIHTTSRGRHLLAQDL